MKGLFPNIDLSFSYWEKIKEGLSPEVLGSLRTEEHHEKVFCEDGLVSVCRVAL